MDFAEPDFRRTEVKVVRAAVFLVAACQVNHLSLKSGIDVPLSNATSQARKHQAEIASTCTRSGRRRLVSNLLCLTLHAAS